MLPLPPPFDLFSFLISNSLLTTAEILKAVVNESQDLSISQCQPMQHENRTDKMRFKTTSRVGFLPRFLSKEQKDTNVSVNLNLSIMW